MISKKFISNNIEINYEVMDKKDKRYKKFIKDVILSIIIPIILCFVIGGFYKYLLEIIANVKVWMVFTYMLLSSIAATTFVIISINNIVKKHGYIFEGIAPKIKYLQSLEIGFLGDELILKRNGEELISLYDFLGDMNVEVIKGFHGIDKNRPFKVVINCKGNNCKIKLTNC